jgi:hypothetical protein
MSLIEQEPSLAGQGPNFAALIEQFQAFADRGEHEAMLDCAARAVQTWPGARRAWYLLTIGLVVAGFQSAARLAMLKAVRVGYEPQPPWLFEMFMLYLEASGEDMPRVAEILKPCPIFGRMQKHLDPVVASTIDQLIQGHVARFESGHFNKPRLIPGKLDAEFDRPLKILMLHTEFVNLGGVLNGNLRNDIADVLEYSAQAQGFDVYRSQATDLLICSPSVTETEVNNALALLEQEIERFRPDILLVDANFIGQANSLQPVHLAAYRARGLRIAAVMGDLYDTRPNLLDHWGLGCDVMIYFNSCTSHAGATMYRDKAMYWPGLPFEDSMFKPLAAAERSIDLCVIGSLNRGREYYAKIMEGSGFPGLYLVHDRTAEKALPVSDYRAHLCRSRMVFNNGTITANQRILTGRVFETIYAGALLLEESGNDIDQLYVPWVHYLPFANVHQLTALAQYVQAREDIRQAMTQRALEWTRTHFAPAGFWQHVRARLAL